MSTWLDLKEAVAENLGKTDGATYNTKREGAILRARRKYYSERQWDFLKKVGVVLTFTTQVAPLPTDFNGNFNPVRVYKYVGNLKYDYRRVEWDDLTSYGSLDYVYAVDNVNNLVKISQNDPTLLIDYTYLPVDITATDGTSDSTVEPAPDITAISLLGTAYFFMSSRQSKASYQVFLDGYKEQLQLDEKKDAGNQTPRFFRPLTTTINTGYRRGF